MISVQVDATRAIAKVGRLDAATRRSIRGAVVELAGDLKAGVLAKLSGGVLNKRSGKLYDSIKQQMVENTTSLFARVYSDGVVYAAIHEYGGTIKHPGSDKFQAWTDGYGGWIYAHKTKPHLIPMPERSYLRSTLEEMRSEIIARLTEAAHEGARAA